MLTVLCTHTVTDGRDQGELQIKPKIINALFLLLSLLCLGPTKQAHVWRSTKQSSAALGMLSYMGRGVCCKTHTGIEIPFPPTAKPFLLLGTAGLWVGAGGSCPAPS